MKTLIKCKIVVNNDGSGITTFFWKKLWWVFGFWYPYGCTSSGEGRFNDSHKTINDDTVSKVLFDNFIHPKTNTPPTI